MALAGGPSPAVRAIECALASGCIDRVIVSVDEVDVTETPSDDKVHLLKRPSELAQDTTPMVEVVQHAMQFSRLLIAHNPSWTNRDNAECDDRFVLIQPTQPLRTAAHIRQALEMLTPEVDSVVSVVEAESPHKLMSIDQGRLFTWNAVYAVERRQDAKPAWRRDGTAYCFWRKTVDEHGSLYGDVCVPLIINPADTCPLDTPQDWLEAERRLRERANARV